MEEEEDDGVCAGQEEEAALKHYADFKTAVERALKHAAAAPV